MPEAYVIDAVRTAVGKRNGSLAGVHPVDLGALGWRGLLDRVECFAFGLFFGFLKHSCL